jgi:hypothetical protein
MNRREFLQFLTVSSISMGTAATLCAKCIDNQKETFERMSDEEFADLMYKMDCEGLNDPEFNRYIEKSGYTISGCTIDTPDLGQQCTCITFCTGSCKFKNALMDKYFNPENK